MSIEIALVSGGVDSVLVTAKHKDAFPAFIDYGQREADYEAGAVKRLWPEAVFLKAPTIVPRGTYFPARNLLLATIAVACCDADKVWMGGMADDFCADKTPEAFAAMSTILSQQAGRPVEVLSPFWKLAKAEAIYQYLNAGGDDQRLLQAFSCYSPKAGVACGDCPACFRKACAFIANDLPAPTISDRLYDEYFDKLHRYPVARQWTIVHAYQRQRGQVTVCDIDGVLTNETEGHDYAGRTPNTEAIVELNIASGKVVLWSSRREIDRIPTIKWLRAHKVHYDALILDKLPADFIYDDLATAALC